MFSEAEDLLSSVGFFFLFCFCFVLYFFSGIDICFTIDRLNCPALYYHNNCF